ncbi:hypothetical protein [Pelagibacterium sediminicola]|uniref:hypothetical protein n=1 Tax=Pelagibacterium sediminicola TaxID=2248761 RepID=UPI000E3215B4|nr:hypothetical protein [Pelagibacterium sediminicola]
MINRTLSLREAVNVNKFGADNGGPGTLQNILKLAHPDGCNIDHRTFDTGQSVLKVLNFERSAKYELIHLVAYTPNDRVQVVPVAGGSVNIGLELAQAPDQTEFLDGEMMLLVRGNDVLVCRCGLPDGALIDYVEHMASHLGIGTDLSRFSLGKRIDMDKMAMIVEEGVHRLRMNAVAHSVSVDHAERETVRKRMLGSVLDDIRALLMMEGKVPEEAENLKVEVSLSFDKRKGGDVERQQIQELAETVLDEDDAGFVIETMTGRKVRANDILLSKTVSMEPFGKSVRHTEAWGHLIEFDSELRAVPNG